jgi:hypothetical protein
MQTRTIDEKSKMIRLKLAEAERRIEKTNKVIQRHCDFIRSREAKGHDTSGAVALLNSYLETRSLLLRDRDRLQKILKECDSLAK